jgi:hypothetical protein
MFKLFGNTGRYRTLNTRYDADPGIKNLTTTSRWCYPKNIVEGDSYTLSGGIEISFDGTTWLTSNSTWPSWAKRFKVRLQSSTTFLAQAIGVAVIKNVEYSFTVFTRAAITTPTAFYFTPVSGAEISTVYTSDAITALAIEAAASISIVGGEFKVNSGSWRSTATTVLVNDTVQVRLTTTIAYSNTNTAILTIGGFSTAYSVQTRAADTTPDAFSFSAVTGAETYTLYTSGAITVAGIEAATSISVSGGEYRINSGSWGTASGSITNGDTAQVRVQSSENYLGCGLDLGAVTGTVTIGGVSASYTVTTKSAPGTGYAHYTDADNYTDIDNYQD